MSRGRPGKGSASRANVEGFTLDLVTGRLVVAGPEENEATQPLLEALTAEAGWNPGQIISRPQWRVPPHPSGKREWPVDVAIFESSVTVGDPNHVRIICECKQPKENAGIVQLKTYLDREPEARVGIWFNGYDHAIVYKTRGGFEVAPAGTPIPTPRDPYKPVGQRTLNYGSLRTPPSLVPVFQRIRNRLAALDSNINRDEEILPDLSLLLLLKILDEQRNQRKPRRPVSIQIDESPEVTAARIRALLVQEVKRNPELFGVSGGKVFQIDDASIHYVVETLQNYRLLGGDKDAVADAFQVIKGKAYKGEEGQYFTPQSVVKIAVAATAPTPDDRIIDPACGSGSFLATAMTRIGETLAHDHAGDEAKIAHALKEWSKNYLFAIDKDSVSVRLSKAYLSMLGDGAAHVFKADAIRSSTWEGPIRGLIQDGSFAVVLTNPPFGRRLTIDAEIGTKEGYDLSREWTNEDGTWKPTDLRVPLPLGLGFLERAMRLLEDGGRLAIVLPDTYLFSPSYGWLIQWLSQFQITHSINVPIEAFEPHCRAKTSIVVVKKRKPAAGHQVIGSLCATFGVTKHGKALYKWEAGKRTEDRDNQMEEAARILSGRPPAKESRLFFRFPQADAIQSGVLVASFWWRKPYLDALDAFAQRYKCDPVTVGELVDSGELTVEPGHGSPEATSRMGGSVPYIKVTHLHNWRIIENPKFFIPDSVADALRRGRYLKPHDLVTPTRACSTIGLFSVVRPWQTRAILTREIAIWRPTSKCRIDRWLLLALLSLKVVHEQFRFLVLMQTNREDLGERWRELRLPIPRNVKQRETWTNPIREYFEAESKVREAFDGLAKVLDPSLFATRPG